MTWDEGTKHSNLIFTGTPQVPYRQTRATHDALWFNLQDAVLSRRTGKRLQSVY